MKLCFALLSLTLILSACTTERQAPVEDIAIPVNAQAIAQGQSIYFKTCSLCHGQSGKGDGPASAAFNPKPRDHTNGRYMDTLSNVHIFNVIKFGGGQYGKPTMPAQPMLSDDDIKATIAYVRTLSNTYRRKQ